MVKIQAQAGNSLADIYDVKGSVAGIEHLETHDLPIVHEMGATVFSERFSQDIRRLQTGALAQNTNWDIIVANLGDNAVRIFGLAVHVDVTSRVSVASIAINREINGREVPIWAWDTGASDIEVAVRYSDDGGATATVIFLRPLVHFGILPSMTTGAEQPTRNNRIAFRGRTSGFGAGTVQATVDIITGFGEIQSGGGLSSRGLPVPSW